MRDVRNKPVMLSQDADVHALVTRALLVKCILSDHEGECDLERS